jgi:HD-GYP domain-containing protein (c-di-GMP phosphodiesterase class II)
MANFGFIPVSLSTFYPADDLGLDLYVRPQGFERPVLFCASKRPPQEAELSRLEESGITKLYIRREARQTYHDFLRGHLNCWLADGSLPITTRAGALSEVIRDVLREAFQGHDTDRLVPQARKLGQLVTALLGSERPHFHDLRRALHHDCAPFTHAANVCCYAVLLAGELGVSARDQEQIAAGALLHDLGSVEIDDRVLGKDGRLAETESRQIREHPLQGFRKLCRHRDLTADQLLMMYQHHEHLDGGGYPVGLAGSEIHLWARICAIADVFEALTCQRPYRRPLTGEATLQVMARESGAILDGELVAGWTTFVQQSPAE